jgi:hypothetical protein
MKFVQIKNDGTMCEQLKDITNRNIRKVLRELSGVKKISHLYEWTHEDSILRCYGCLDGKSGQENKHDLPLNGVKIIETLDNSDTQLLFNDIYIVKITNKSYQDLDVSDYGLFYSVCFEGFDECHSDDMTSDEEDSETSSLNDFINDDLDTIDNIDDLDEILSGDNISDTDSLDDCEDIMSDLVSDDEISTTTSQSNQSYSDNGLDELDEDENEY